MMTSKTIARGTKRSALMAAEGKQMNHRQRGMNGTKATTHDESGVKIAPWIQVESSSRICAKQASNNTSMELKSADGGKAGNNNKFDALSTKDDDDRTNDNNTSVDFPKLNMNTTANEKGTLNIHDNKEFPLPQGFNDDSENKSDIGNNNNKESYSDKVKLPTTVEEEQQDETKMKGSKNNNEQQSGDNQIKGEHESNDIQAANSDESHLHQIGPIVYAMVWIRQPNKAIITTQMMMQLIRNMKSQEIIQILSDDDYFDMAMDEYAAKVSNAMTAEENAIQRKWNDDRAATHRDMMEEFHEGREEMIARIKLILNQVEHGRISIQQSNNRQVVSDEDEAPMSIRGGGGEKKAKKKKSKK